MNTIKKSDAIRSLLVDAKFILDGDAIIWMDDRVQPSDGDIEDELNRLTSLSIVENAKSEFNGAIQSHLDTKAQEMRYDNIMSARSYAGYDNEFQVEAVKLAQWASSCWVVAGQIESDVMSGTRTMPTVNEVISELPIYT